MPDANSTKLRLPKSTKARLNDVAGRGGFSAELLADLLLNEALDQIEDDLMPTAPLTHVPVLRKRLGKRVVEFHTVAAIDRYLAAQGKPLLSDQIDSALEAELRAAEAPTAAPPEQPQAQRQGGQSQSQTRYSKKKTP